MAKHIIMKKLTLLFSLLLPVTFAFAQGIRYETSMEAALAKGKDKKKPVLLIITVPPRPGYHTTSALDAPDVVKKFNESFISYQVSITDSAGIKLRSKYSSNIYPAYFFLDKYGNVLYKDNRNAIVSKKFLDMADSALLKYKSGKNLGEYEARYAQGKVDKNFLKEYITLRQNLSLFDNNKLIEEYVNYLTIAELNSYSEVLFILKAGPLAYGRAYKLAYTNTQIADSVYKREPLALRSAINSYIINNTYKEAVATKNNMMAQNMANFIRNINSKNYAAGNNSATSRMLSYYLAVKDTANYLQQASYHYDSYMRISADSVKRLTDSARARTMKLLNAGQKSIPVDSMKKLKITSSTRIVFREAVTAIPAGSDVAGTLNNAAYTVYNTGTHNPNYLIKAIGWSRRSILLKPVWPYYDTLAHLLYVYGFMAEAEASQLKALELARAEPMPVDTKHLEEELQKIKARTL